MTQNALFPSVRESMVGRDSRERNVNIEARDKRGRKIHEKRRSM